MQATGVHVKALDTMPELLDVDLFYLDMYRACGSNFSNLNIYCSLYGFSNEETLEALDIMLNIAQRV